MTPKDEHLRISSGELFDKPHPSNIVPEKNGGSKWAIEVGNDDDDCKKSKTSK